MCQPQAHANPEPDPLPTLEGLRSQDERSRDSAWDRAYDGLWTVAFSALRGDSLNDKEREDIVADVIIEVQQGIIGKSSESFNRMVTFDDLLKMTYTIVRRRCIDFIRARERRREDSTDEPPENHLDLDAASLPFSDGFTSGERDAIRKELDARIDRLKPPKPEICRAHYWLGQTTAQIAARLGMHRGSVCSHLYQAMRDLRDGLGGQLDGWV